MCVTILGSDTPFWKMVYLTKYQEGAGGAVVQYHQICDEASLGYMRLSKKTKTKIKIACSEEFQMDEKNKTKNQSLNGLMPV